MSTNTYNVPTMSCDHCVASITGEVTKVAGVDSVDIDLVAKTVLVTGGDDAAIRAAIDEAGFDIAV
jgi:copper chaperone